MLIDVENLVENLLITNAKKVSSNLKFVNKQQPT